MFNAILLFFQKKYFSEIRSLRGDQGCKVLIEKSLDSTIGVHVNSSEVSFDCDTMDDYSVLISNDLKYVET